jgi:hypothetical protein
VSTLYHALSGSLRLVLDALDRLSLFIGVVPSGTSWFSVVLTLQRDHPLPNGCGWYDAYRAVPVWLKGQVYAENGITQYKTGDYEVDHLIPLSLEVLIPFVTFGPNRQKRCPGTPM